MTRIITAFPVGGSTEIAGAVGLNRRDEAVHSPPPDIAEPAPG
jgi:hypothetical protein